jgi:hypothetical protein
MRALAREIWLGAGRDGFAFERLAWKTAQRIIDEPPIWAAIAAVAQAELAQPVQDGERVLRPARTFWQSPAKRAKPCGAYLA